MKIKSPPAIKPHGRVRLTEIPTAPAHSLESHKDAAKILAKRRSRLAALQEVLYAGEQYAVLVVLQGMDTAGKDGTIAHIFSGVNPQGCAVTSFKTPTLLEARHDFLWRCHAAVPAKGIIGIFNRSHYEDVLFPRVHKQITVKEARRRFDEINAWEQMLFDNGTIVLKFFLHISAAEQTRRLQARLDDPDKHWKFSDGDLKERQFWPDYQTAYEDLLAHTSRKHAPWYVIPADDKAARNLYVSGVIVEALAGLKLAYPKPTMDVSQIQL